MTYKRQNSFAAAIVVTLALLSIPFLLLGLGLLEELIWGSGNIAWIYRRLGIYEPLKALLDAIRALLGF